MKAALTVKSVARKASFHLEEAAVACMGRGDSIEDIERQRVLKLKRPREKIDTSSDCGEYEGVRVLGLSTTTTTGEKGKLIDDEVVSFLKFATYDALKHPTTVVLLLAAVALDAVHAVLFCYQIAMLSLIFIQLASQLGIELHFLSKRWFPWITRRRQGQRSSSRSS